jgi:hypothetical protein
MKWLTDARRCWPRRFRLWCGVLAVGFALLAGGARGAPGQVTSEPISGLKMTLHRYANGNPKTILTSRKADVPPPGEDGEIRGLGVVVYMYAPTGEEEGRIEAAECYYDRVNGTARSSTLVRVRRQGVEITGTGMEWSSESQKVKLLKDVRIEFSRKQLMKERRKQP